MIEGFNDDYIADRLKGLANRRQKRQCIVDARLLFRHHPFHSLCPLVSLRHHHLMQGGKCTQNYVMRSSQSPEFPKILGGETSDSASNFLHALVPRILTVWQLDARVEPQQKLREKCEASCRIFRAIHRLDLGCRRSSGEAVSALFR